MPALSKRFVAAFLNAALISAVLPPTQAVAAETYVVPSMSRPALKPYPGNAEAESAKARGADMRLDAPLSGATRQQDPRTFDPRITDPRVLTPRGSSVPGSIPEGAYGAMNPLLETLPGEEATESLRPFRRMPEALSAMERFFAQAPGMKEGKLRQFGYATFQGDLAGGSLASESGVPGSYPLGPGDELILNAPLSTDELRAVVDRSGKVFLPGRGLVSVSGMTLDQFQAMMRGGKGSQVSVRLGRLRALTVHLAGRVERPGSYTVNALSTVTTLLQKAGGVSKNGSLRQVQIRRAGKTVATFDLYDFLLKGGDAGNQRLEAGDVVFVPNIGAMVAIAGSVRQPAIYELKPGTTSVSEAVTLAGGLLPQAYTERVQLQRVNGNQGREIRTLDFTKGAAQATQVQDGDLLLIAGALDRVSNGVTLTGNVERPGWYEILPGTRISQVIGQLGELKSESYFDYAQIEREVGEDRHREIIPFNLGKALRQETDADLVLQPRDTITIYANDDFQHVPEVEIHGAVLRPGKYRLYPNMRLAALIGLAGGMLPEADRQGAELTRTQVIESYMKRNRYSLSPEAALQGSESDNPVLAKDDVVLIHKVPNYHKTWTVEVTGEVMRPGTYSILEGETLSQLLERAGGFTPRAYAAGGFFTRESIKLIQQQQMMTLADRIEQTMTSLQFKSNDQTLAASVAAQEELVKRLRNTQATGRIVVDLDKPNRMRQEGHDLILTHGDKLYVPPRNDTVSVLGAVYAPNALIHASSMTVEDYLKEAGGSTPVGDLNNLYVIRADGKVHALRNYSEGWWIFRRGLMSSHLNPGDTIIVPEKVEWVDLWGEFLKNSAAVAQILTSGALLYNTFK